MKQREIIQKFENFPFKKELAHQLLELMSRAKDIDESIYDKMEAHILLKMLYHGAHKYDLPYYRAIIIRWYNLTNGFRRLEA